MKIVVAITVLTTSLLVSCKNTKETRVERNKNSETTTTHIEVVKEKPVDMDTPQGMVWVPGGNFTQGARQGDQFALDHEKPAHPVAVDGFFMDITEVTNDEFSKFVKDTGYIT